MKSTRTYNWLSKLPILVVYLLFFTVQIFYNLESNRRLFNAQRAAVESYQNTVGQGKVSVKKTTAHSQSHRKLWLNKRYEPSTFPVPALIVTEIPGLHIEPLKIGTDIIQYYTAVLVSGYGLRGPPLVA